MANGLNNEKEILIRVAGDDEAAFRELVIHYNPQLMAYIFTLTKSRERSEEVVQDIFLQVWTARATLPSINNFRAFLFVIAKNLALNALRNALREKNRQKKWEQTNNESEAVEPAQYNDGKNIIDLAIDRLPPQQKRVWVATRREGLSLAETAAEMGISVGTVKKYVKYANQSITAYLLEHKEILLVVSLFWAR